MKKIVLLSGIIISILVSCSTDDDIQTDYNQKSRKINFSREADSDFCITCRDTIDRDNDSIVESEPVRPKKD